MFLGSSGRAIEIASTNSLVSGFLNQLPSGKHTKSIKKLLKMAIYSGFTWIYRLKMVIVHSYVSLPEGKPTGKSQLSLRKPTWLFFFEMDIS